MKKTPHSNIKPNVVKTGEYCSAHTIVSSI